MAKPKLDSAGISLFCESVAMMLAAGIQTDEAVGMLSEDIGDVALQATCESVYGRLCAGDTLAVAMKASGAFPRYAVDMVGVGEASGMFPIDDKTGAYDEGMLDKFDALIALRSLGVYYDEEDRLFAKIRSSVGYPAALLCIMSIILAFTVIIILPVFEDVYVSMAGSLTDGSSGAVGVSVAIGWVALGITLICAIVAVGAAIACRSEAGRIAVMHLMEKFPATRPAMEQLAVSRFASALAAYTASGINTDEAMRRAIEVVEHEGLKAKATAAYGLMIDAESPRSLAQAISEAEVFEQIHARLLTIGTRSGSLDAALDRLSANFFDDAILQIDAAIDNIEPALAAFLTIAVGATLISVMLPLIGIMGSIG